jgi:hypothetical protein
MKVHEKSFVKEEDFLPYVAFYLNPRTNVSPTARMWTMESSVLRSPKGLGSSAEWALQARSKAISFVLGSVELALLSIGVFS